MLKTPVLFLTFKRFETTKLVFEAIRQAKPAKLYFVNNAPRPDFLDEVEKVEKIRSLVHQIDWECEVITLFRKEHLPVKYSITDSINWFFSKEEKGIILEDDCLPSQDFFKYCEELLTYYQNDNRVLSIGGSCFYEKESDSSDTYQFSKHLYIWGWATWKRAWFNYDVTMSEWPKYKKANNLKKIFKSWLIRKYWTLIFDKTYKNELKTWDYQWVFAMWLQDGFSIVPNRNMVSNIGFGVDSNFTKNPNSIEANLPVSKINFPLLHPVDFIRNREEEDYVSKFVYKIGLSSFLINESYALYARIKHIFKKHMKLY